MRNVKQQSKLRRILAADANLKIEGGEVILANLLKAVNVIEAQEEGIDPKEVNLDFDANVTVDEIVEKLFPKLDDEAKADIKGLLESLKGEAETEEVAEEVVEEDEDIETEVDEDVEDEDIEVNEEVEDEDEFDERFKNPDFKAGFEAGVKYGEKREKADPKRIDEDHEREGEERHLRAIGEDTIANLKKEMRQEMRALNQAAQKVAPLVGTIQDVMVFDSATEIYKFALEQSGKKVSNYPKEAYAGMVDMLLEQREVVIGDSVPTYKGNFSDKELKAFDRLKKISK